MNTIVHKVVSLSPGLLVPRLFWLLLALSFPLFSVDWIRFSFGGHIAIPMVVMGGVFCLGTLIFMQHRLVLRRTQYRSLLFLLASCFFLWHLLALVQTEYVTMVRTEWNTMVRTEFVNKAIIEVFKLAFSLICAWVIILFFPRDSRFGERFWFLVMVSVIPILLLLIYKYVVVFRIFYLGTNLDDPSRHGRNQLAWFIGLILPYVLACFMTRNNLSRMGKGVALISLFVLLVSWIYIGSRGSWISVSCGCMVMLLSSRKFGRFLFLVFVGVLGYWVLTLNVGELDSQKRFIYLFNPSAVPDLKSYDIRLGLIFDTLELASESPIVGFGLGFTKNTMHDGRWPHNDYMAILCDMGLVGISLFLGLFAVVSLNLWAIKFREGISWVLLGSRGAFISVVVSLSFTDTYTTPLLWIFLGLCVVSSETERSAALCVASPA